MPARVTPTGGSLWRLIEPGLKRAVPLMTSREMEVVGREIEVLLGLQDDAGNPLEQARRVASAVPERVYQDSAEVLLRMHQVANYGNYASCLSSLPIVKACFELGLAGLDPGPARAELIVGRGHIAPDFYAEQYTRGQLPLAPLMTLHQGGLTGVVHQRWGFRNTMRYSLGVGLAQAVSRAWELHRQGSQDKVICLAGDAELQEGVSFECLRFMRDAGLPNLVLVIDANGKGIEKLMRPLDADLLRVFFDRVEEVEGSTWEPVHERLQSLLSTSGSSVLICRTQKGEHGFRNPGSASEPSPFSKSAGGFLAAFAKSHGVEMAVFTADMASRFGLKTHVPYVNVGLSETLSVGMVLSLPAETLKVIATDGKYYLDSLNMLTEVAMSASRVVVLCGRSWGVWGGAVNACNLLGLVMGTHVYEPVTRPEFDACLRRALERQEGIQVLSLIDAPVAPLPVDCAESIDGGVWLVEPRDTEHRVAVVSFGYASTLVRQANERELPHLHCMALRPELSATVLAELRRFESILVVEYNGVKGGIGEYLRSQWLLPCVLHGVERDPDTCPHEFQLERQGMNVEKLRTLLREFALPPVRR